MAELGGLLGAVDQAVTALRTLAARRARPGPGSPAEDVTDVALLRFGVLQFVGAFGRRQGSARLTPRQAFGEDGARFFEHIRTFGQELDGAHARLVGVIEPVVLVRRHDGRAAAHAVTTRTRRPDRLAPLELAQLIAFMERGVEAYALRASELRATLGEEVRALDQVALEKLPLVET